MAQDPRSPDEIERDLSATRHHLESTLDALQDRMSPGSMFEDALDYVRRDGGAFGRNLVETVRDNPLPATLLTIGLGWLMVAGRNGAAGRHYGALVPAEEYEAHDVEGHGPSVTERAGQTAANARERIRDIGRSVRAQQEATVHGTSQAAHAISDSARQSWASARSGADAAMTRTRDMVSGMGESSRAAGRSMAGFFEKNPLTAGLMAVAAGAALAAALPRSRTEDETLGPLRERAIEQGRAQAARLSDDAAERTRAAVQAAAHPPGSGTSQASREESRGSAESENRPGTTSQAGKAAARTSSAPSSTGGMTSTGVPSPSSPSPARPTGSPPTAGSGSTPPPRR
jgi:hypothetical protein